MAHSCKLVCALASHATALSVSQNHVTRDAPSVKGRGSGA